MFDRHLVNSSQVDLSILISDPAAVPNVAAAAAHPASGAPPLALPCD